MGKFRPCKAGSRQYKRGNSPHRGQTFHMLSYDNIIYEEFIALLGSPQNGAEFHPGQPESCNHQLNINFLRLVIIS